MAFSVLPYASAQAACSAPAGVEGQIYYDGAVKALKLCDGANWVGIGGGGGSSGPCSGGNASGMVNGRCYARFDTAVNRATAIANCQAWGGYLAAFESPEAFDAFLAHPTLFPTTLPVTTYYHMDYSDAEREGVWVSYKRGPAYIRWASGQPDNAGNAEHCGTLFIVNTGGLPRAFNDHNCSAVLRYICEK